MREETQMSSMGGRSSKGRKVLTVFGIIFIAMGVFLASFTCSFQVMIESAKAAQMDGDSLENENKKLREDVQLLQDQITILETELTRYQGTDSAKAGATAAPSAKPGATATSSAKKNTAASQSSTSSKPTATATKSSAPTATAKSNSTAGPGQEIVE